MYYMIIIGLIALSFLAVYLWVNRTHHIPNPVEAEGEIVEIERISNPSINPLYILLQIVGVERKSVVRFYPVVRFKLGQEKRVRFRNRKGYAERGQYSIGDKVQIVYSQENPLIAKIKD